MKRENIFVTKADSLGNEVWSATFGREGAKSDDASAFKGDYLKYDEVGVCLVELPDEAGYTIACNRTYVQYADKDASVGTRGQTKIVLFKIDRETGTVIDANPNSDDRGVELNQETADTLTERVSDMKLDNSSGIIKYVLTGMTTNVPTNKATIPGNDNSVSDRSDIYTVALKEDFSIDWKTGNITGGLIGEDYGVSVQILPQGYLICGTIDRNYDPTGASFQPYSDLLAVFMDKTSGQPTNPNFYGSGASDFRGGHSVYNAAEGRVTIFGHVEAEGGSGQAGRLVLVQIDEGGAAQSINSSLITYLDVKGTASSSSPYISASIAELPDNEGFVLSSTYKEFVNIEHDICIIKVSPDFEIGEEWPFFFGYNEVGDGGVFATQDEAGTVLPITETITGTSQTKLTGYIFSGTIGLGTNSMLGVIKLNADGKFTPK